MLLNFRRLGDSNLCDILDQLRLFRHCKLVLTKTGGATSANVHLYFATASQNGLTENFCKEARINILISRRQRETYGQDDDGVASMDGRQN